MYPRRCPYAANRHGEPDNYVAPSVQAFRRHLMMQHGVLLQGHGDDERFVCLTQEEAYRRRVAIGERRRGHSVRLRAERDRHRAYGLPPPELSIPPSMRCQWNRSTVEEAAGQPPESGSDSPSDWELDAALPEVVDMPELATVGRMQQQYRAPSPTSTAGAALHRVPPSTHLRPPPSFLAGEPATRSAAAQTAPQMTIDRAVDARPLPPAPRPEVFIELPEYGMEAPDIPIPALAEEITAIMVAYPDVSPGTIVDRFVNTCGGMMAAPQREALDWGVRLACRITSHLCEDLFATFHQSFGVLDMSEQQSTPVLRAMLSYAAEQLELWHRRPTRRD